MSNDLGLYDPLFYAQEAMILLQKNLGLAGRVHRGYDKEPQAKGSTIQIRRPSTFVATDVNPATGGTTQNLNPEEVSITLNQWKEVKFGLSERELSATQETIIEEHIAPATYAVADAIDQAIAALYKKVPWVAATIADVATILSARKVLVDNGVPLKGPNIHCMLGSTAEAALLGLQAFTQYQGAGEEAVQTMLSASLGRKFGVEFFTSQNTPSFTSGTHADTAGVCSGTAGAETLTITGLTTGQTVVAGDSFSIAGDAQRYVFTENKTVASPGTITSVGIFPALKTSPSAAVVTLNASGVTSVQNLMFHRNFAALAMAPLTEIGNKLGARIATVVDPSSGLTIRSRLFYDADKNTAKVSLDALFGVAILDPNLAVRAGAV